MESMEPEVWRTLLEVGGTPALVAFVLYMAWTNGPKADMARMGEQVEQVSSDLSKMVSHLREEMTSGRKEIFKEQERTRERLHRIEVLMEMEAIRARARAGRRRRLDPNYVEGEDGPPSFGAEPWLKESGGEG